MEFDQNIGRTDLLPSTIPWVVLLGLALVGLLAWIFVHRALHRRRDSLRTRTRFAILLPVATVGCWCLYQFLGRLLYLAGAWPLWLAALLTAATVEGVSLFYEKECSIVPIKLARGLVLCRMLAIGITLFILMQPVFVRNRFRSIRRRVAVLLDESSSMNRPATQWTLGERLDMAQALGLVKPADRPLAGIAESADRLRASFRSWQQLLAAANSVVASEDSSKETKSALDYLALAKDAAAVSEWTKPIAEAVSALSKTVSDQRYSSGRDAANALQKGHADLVTHSTILSSDNLPSRPASELLASAAAIVDAYDRILLHLERAIDTSSAALWNSLSAELRNTINHHVELRRVRLAQSLLAGSKKNDVPSLYEKLRSRYDVDLFRFGSEVRRISDLNAHFQWLATNSVDAIEYIDTTPIPGTKLEKTANAPTSKKPTSLIEAREVSFQSASDITRALESVSQAIPSEELAGILFLTDGRHTGDAGVEAISRRLGQASVPVSTVVIGGTRPLLDVAIADVRTAETVFLGDRVRITADLTATGAKGQVAEIRLYRDDLPDPVDTKTYDIASDDWVREVRLNDQPEDKGVVRYRIETDILRGETITANNFWSTDISISDDRTNVLLVDQRPRWEYRYLRNLFYGRDKSVHLQYHLVEPDTISGQSRDLPPASASREFGDAEAGSLPVSRDEWRKFDVLIFGDVGEETLTPEVIENIRFCVEERGALAVFLAGPHSMPYGIQSDVFRNLLPVVPLYTPPMDLLKGPEESFHVTLTPAGRAHDIMALSSSASENEQIWAEQPDWTWRLPIEDVKPGAEILAFAQDTDVSHDSVFTTPAPTTTSSENDDEDQAEAAIARLNAIRRHQTRNALFTVQGKGRGRVAMLLTDRTWRLRYRVGDTYHHRFWGQMMRWGVGEKLRAGNTYVRLGTDQLRYTPHEPIRVLARLADADFSPIQDATVSATLSRDGRVIRQIDLKYRPDSNGMYEADLDPIADIGMYTLSLQSKDAAQRLGSNFPKDLTTRFSIITARRPAEFVHATADWKVPRTMARLSGGVAVTPSRALSLWNAFGEGSGLVPERIETPLWNSPWLFLLVLLCLTTEWILRKRGSLA